MLYNIPAEIRNCPQWIVWRLEPEGNRLTKRPISCYTGNVCAVTDSMSWTTFEHASAILQQYPLNISGCGFVLGYNSGIVGIDIDDVLHTTGQIASPLRFAIADELNSYTELSPSRTGLHVLVQAKLAGGRRHDGVEVYGDGRFFTMTGDVYGSPRPLRQAQFEVEQLVKEISEQQSRGAAPPLNWMLSPIMSDDAVLNIARNAENADKFNDLWNGQWQKHNQSQSEADFGLINIIGNYTNCPSQILRLFRQSALGQRAKAGRITYVGGMIARSQDQKAPMIHLAPPPSVVTSELPTVPYDVEEAEESAVLRDEVFQPAEGFVKTLADWFYDQSIYPMAEIATVGALGMIAGIVGRQYQFQKQGLNLYLMVLAETGSGKDALGTGVSRLFDAVCKPPPDYMPVNGSTNIELGFPAARDFQGPSRLTGKGLLREFHNKNTLSMVSVLPEFSQTMSSMADANANEGVRDFQHALLEFYTKSAEGAMYGGSMNADKSKDIKPLSSPSFTMLCEGTPQRFYNALTETMITDGLLSRFIVIEKKGYGHYNADHALHATVPDQVKIGLQQLCQHVITLRQHSDVRIHVKTTDDAAEYSERLRQQYRERGKVGLTEVHKFLWMRAHQNLTRIAALVAIGVDPFNPIVTTAQLQWANRIVFKQVVTMIAKFKRGDTGKKQGDESEQYTAVMGIIEKWLTLSPHALRGKGLAEAHNNGLIPYSYIHTRTAAMRVMREGRLSSTLALRGVLDAMQKAGVLELTKVVGSSATFYRIHL